MRFLVLGLGRAFSALRSHFIFFAVVYPFESQLLFLDIFNCSSIVMRAGRQSRAPPQGTAESALTL
jgi:hypothetical protein